MVENLQATIVVLFQSCYYIYIDNVAIVYIQGDISKFLKFNENATIWLLSYNGGISKLQGLDEMHLIVMNPKQKYIFVIVKNVHRILQVHDTFLSTAILYKIGYKSSLDNNKVDWIPPIKWFIYINKFISKAFLIFFEIDEIIIDNLYILIHMLIKWHQVLVYALIHMI